MTTLIRGRESSAVLVPGPHGVSGAEIQLSALLNIPVQAASPFSQESELLGTKSASGRLLRETLLSLRPTRPALSGKKSARAVGENFSLNPEETNGFLFDTLSLPPISSDIVQVEELFDTLAVAVYRHPRVTRWLIKLEDESAAKGTLILEVDDVVRNHVSTVGMNIAKLFNEALEKESVEKESVEEKACLPR